LGAKLPPREIRLAEDRWAVARHAVETIAIVAAGLWAFYVFIYQEKIKPAADPVSITLTIDVQRLGRDAKREILRLDIGLRNSGKTELDIAADGYNVWGLRYGSKAVISDRRGQFSQHYSDAVPLRSQTLVDSYAELRGAAVGGFPGNHIVLEPGEETPIHYMIVVPRGAYDAVRAQAIYVPIKTSDTRKLPVTIRSDRTKGIMLATPPDSDTGENDDETNFALIP
jgi:hypothetical protein